ncbi:ATP-binding cassette [Parelusimicrobium proximum]|uniref:ABC transporter ATP-binding protein n=1 Tax=Parelusimicrobium proximum TaxID=3228953 RepID=UPI003D17EF79
MAKIAKLENIIDKNIFVENVKRIWPYVKKYWVRALLGFVLTIPVGSLDAVIAVFLRFYTDHIIVAKQTQFAATIPIAIIIFSIGQGVLNYAVAYFNTWVATKITSDIKKELYQKLMTLDTSFYDSTQSGTIVQRFSTDADQASTSLINNLKQFFTRIFSSLFLVGVLFYNSWHLAFLAIGIVALAVAPMTFVRKKMKGVIAKHVVNNSEAVTAYNETFNGNKIISSYNLQAPQTRRFNSIIDTFFSLSMKMVKYTNWLSPLMHIIISIGIALVLLFANTLILKGVITSGNFVSFLAALLMLYTPIKTMGNNYVDIQKSFLALDRIFEIFKMEPSIKDKKDAETISTISGSIEFKNVNFEYVKGKPVLKNINVRVPVGKTIALVGNSGGGKSTFVNLIPRFYDVTSGSVRIDGTDVRDISLFSLRQNISVVFQDNFLFGGTIRENIMMGNPDATEEDLQSAVKSAHLSDFFDTLELGLDTVIGERGVTLSGGQKQRVAIARAFIKNAPVVILDEATSALDNKSEAVVQKAIDKLMENRTVFVIAHRLSTVRNADEILVINDGEIVEKGSHDELLKDEDGAYSMLYNAQFKNKK